jgi:hypothetical protein
MSDGGSNGSGRSRSSGARRADLRRRLLALLDRAAGTGDSVDAGRSGAFVRHAAASRPERRLAAGVVVVADVRDEQELLERLASLVDRGWPLSPEVFAAVERMARETSPPSLPSALRELRALLAGGMAISDG